MNKHLTCSADTYISERVIDGAWRRSANVGRAGTLDLYKLYNQTRTIVSGSSQPNTERTRLLLSFDDSWLRSAASAGALNVNHSSFRATLILRDAYGGQPAPQNLTITAWPLSRSFAEGDGRDIVLMSDSDEANWLTASSGQAWSVTGCGQGGTAPAACDYFTSSSNGQYALSGVLVDGTEDLLIDVTRLVRERLTGELPSLSVMLKLTSADESSDQTLFVKRFSSRHAHDQSKTPRISLEWDASVWDDSSRPIVDEPVTLLTAFYRGGRLASVTSGSQTLTGSGCMIVTLSSGSWSSSYTASQHSGAAGPIAGLYSASFTLSSDDAVVGAALADSGSFAVTPTWTSLGGRALRRGDPLTFTRSSAETETPSTRLIAAYDGLAHEYAARDIISVRVSIIDVGAVAARVVKQPRASSSVPLRGATVAVISALSGDRVCDIAARSSESLSFIGGSYSWSWSAEALPIGASLQLQAYAADGNKIGEPSAAFVVH